MNVPSHRLKAASSGADVPPVPRGIVGTLQEIIPPAQVAARIQEMMAATRPDLHGVEETDWRTVEAGIRLYLDYTAHPAAGPSHGPAPAPVVPPAPESPVASRRTYSAYQVDLTAPVSRPSFRFLPRKGLAPSSLEPLDDMGKLLVPGTPLAALQAPTLDPAMRHRPGPQESPVASASRASGTSRVTPLTANLAAEEEARRNLPLIALVSLLVVGGALAGLSQFSLTPSTSATPSLSVERLAQSNAEAAAEAARKTPPETGVAAFQPRFDASLW